MDSNQPIIKIIRSVHEFIVTKDDLVYGKDILGLLGLGKNRESEPTIIPELCYKQIIEFYNGLEHCIARSIDGKLYIFGSNRHKNLGKTDNISNNSPKLMESLINENVIQVSCGSFHTIVLTQKGKVFGWGDNSSGQIGINNKEKSESITTNINGFNGEKIQSISCGSEYSMALTVSGNVFSWGNNSCGQLGINSTENSFSPQIIEMKDKRVSFKTISCGPKHSLLLSTDGNIYSFGNNNECQLGYETNETIQMIPRMIETNPKIHFSDIFCYFRENYSSALSSTDCLYYVWGKYLNKIIKTMEMTELAFTKYRTELLTNQNFKNNITANRFENEYKDSKLFSSGSFGDVFKAVKVSNNKSYAIKRIIIEEKELINDKFLAEIEFLTHLRSRFVVEYKQSWIENAKHNNKQFLYIEMELCLKTFKQLNQELMVELNCKQSFSESIVGFYIMSALMIEVIQGVNYLHKNNIIHRDLKPQNILITEFKNGRIVKIADFGISCIHETRITDKSEDISHTGDVGDNRYMAPELKQWTDQESDRLVYNEKVDIYSLAIIFDDMIGNFDTNEIESQLLITLKKSKIKNLKQIIERMKSKNPEERPDCAELLKNERNYFMNLLDLNEMEKISDYFNRYSNIHSVYLENKFFYYLNNGKHENIIVLLSSFLNKQIIELIERNKFSIALTDDGKVCSFGSNNKKQLGYETENEDNNRPKIIESLFDEKVTQISCGINHTIVLTQNGEVFGWGNNLIGQSGITGQEHVSVPTKYQAFNGEKMQSISCGNSHSMGLTVNGNVFGWGCNISGELGINSPKFNQYIPQMVQISDKSILFKRISCGPNHTLLLSTEGNIYSCGSYQLGYEEPKGQQLIPLMIETNPKIHFSDIFCHFYENFSLALSSTDGFCYIWGKYKNRFIITMEKTEYKSFEEIIEIFNNKYKHFF